MDIVAVAAGCIVNAAAEGEQRFADNGPGAAIRMNGNPADYRLDTLPDAPGERTWFALVALNGTGRYEFADTLDRVYFLSGAFSLVRNLPAVIAAGDRGAVRRLTTDRFVSYAQIQEDVLLMRVLRDIDPAAGFYIDVGAYDPDEDTVTRLFYERGWHGINLEPSAIHHRRLEERWPRDINLRVAVSDRAGRMRFFENDGEQLGTLEPRFAGGDGGASVEVDVVTLSDVCGKHAPRNIHFLKIDVEGHERNVLTGAALDTWRPWIVIVEAVAPNRADVATFGEWEDILLDADYRLAAEDELNRYYLARERSDLVPAFQLPIDQYRRADDMARIVQLERELAEARDNRSLIDNSWRARAARYLGLAAR